MKNILAMCGASQKFLVREKLFSHALRVPCCLSYRTAWANRENTKLEHGLPSYRTCDRVSVCGPVGLELPM